MTPPPVLHVKSNAVTAHLLALGHELLDIKDGEFIFDAAAAPDFTAFLSSMGNLRRRQAAAK